MTIEFIGLPRVTEQHGVLFRVVFGGHPRLCHISDQALALASTARNALPLETFHAHADALLEAAAGKLRMASDETAVVHVYSEDVRAASARRSAASPTRASHGCLSR